MRTEVCQKVERHDIQTSPLLRTKVESIRRYRHEIAVDTAEGETTTRPKARWPHKGVDPVLFLLHQLRLLRDPTRWHYCGLDGLPWTNARGGVSQQYRGRFQDVENSAQTYHAKKTRDELKKLGIISLAHPRICPQSLWLSRIQGWTGTPPLASPATQSNHIEREKTKTPEPTHTVRGEPVDRGISKGNSNWLNLTFFQQTPW